MTIEVLAPGVSGESSSAGTSVVASKTASVGGPASLSQRVINLARKVEANEIPEIEQDTVWISNPPFGIDISSLDLDIMKLTAQFVARNGHQFHVGLMNREHKNPQFDFLKPVHPLHTFFQSLVEAYTRCSSPLKGLIEKLKMDYENKQALLDRLIIKFVCIKQREAQKKMEEEKKEEELVSLIDWHDFVIVETIDFQDEEGGQVLEQQQQQQETEMETEDMDMEMQTDEAEPQQQSVSRMEMNVRKDYVKPSAASSNVLRALQYQLCPKCGQEIPIDEMEQHMKIELLDPKYRQQRQAALERSKGLSLANDQEISRNLELFAKKRTDIFGDKEEEIDKTIQGEKEKPPEKIVWDGHTASIARTTNAVIGRTIEEQIAAIHSMKGMLATNKSEEKPLIGPDTSGPPIPPTPNMAPIVPPAPPMPSLQHSTSVHPSMLFTPTSSMFPPPPPPPPAPLMQSSVLSDENFAAAKRLRIDTGNLSMSYSSNQSMLSMPPPPPPSQQQQQRNLLHEDQWIAMYSDPISIQVETPEDSSKPEWKLEGQMIGLQMSLKDTVAMLKEKIKASTGMPPNKQKLKYNGIGLVDAKTLAFYNIAPGSVVELGQKTRGGKK